MPETKIDHEKAGANDMREFIDKFKLALKHAGFDDLHIAAVVAATLPEIADYVIREMKKSTKLWEETIKKLKHERH